MFVFCSRCRIICSVAVLVVRAVGGVGATCYRCRSWCFDFFVAFVTVSVMILLISV